MRRPAVPGAASRCSTRVAVALAVLVLAALVNAGAAGSHVGGALWSLTTVMQRVDNARVTIGGWSGRVRAPATLCSGHGVGLRRHSVRRWRHFTCTWTTFTPGGTPDRDVTFRVHPLDAKRFAITNTHFGP